MAGNTPITLDVDDLVDEIDRVRRMLFTTTLLGVGPELERWAASAIVEVKARCDAGGVPGWFAWSMVEALIGDLVRSMTSTALEAELIDRWMDRCKAYLESTDG